MAEQRNVAAEQKTREEPKAAPPPRPAPAPLGAAGESGDPLVHQVLAELATAVSNGDADAEAALTGRLAELGVQ
jgi:hypothetical protein